MNLIPSKLSLLTEIGVGVIDKALAFLKQLGIEPKDVKPLLGGFSNNSYVVSLANERVVLKQYLRSSLQKENGEEAGQDEGILTVENNSYLAGLSTVQQVSDDFAKAGISTAAAKALNGRTLHFFEGFVWQIFEYVEPQQGEHPVDLSSKPYAIGATLAKIHKASLNFNVPTYKIHAHSGRLITLLARYFQNPMHADLKSRTKTIIKRAHIDLTHLLPIQGSFILTHGDMHPGNVLWDKGPCLIDWERTGYYHKAFDILALALNWSIHETEDAINSENTKVWNSIHFTQCLMGYSSLESLKVLNEQFDEAFTLVTQSWLSWLIELSMFYDQQRLSADTFYQEFEYAISTLEIVFRNRLALIACVEKIIS